jgi:hypothetical protein
MSRKRTVITWVWLNVNGLKQHILGYMARVSDERHAHPRLASREVATPPAKQTVSRSAVAKSISPAAPASPLPARTDWVDGKPENAGARLTEYAVRIGKVHAWLTLSGRPGQTGFPYQLVLRKPSSDAAVRTSVLYGGEQYKLYL